MMFLDGETVGMGHPGMATFSQPVWGCLNCPSPLLSILREAERPVASISVRKGLRLHMPAADLSAGQRASPTCLYFEHDQQ